MIFHRKIVERFNRIIAGCKTQISISYVEAFSNGVGKKRGSIYLNNALLTIINDAIAAE